MTLLLTQANIAPKKLTEKPHYKRHRTKKPKKFHSPSPTIHKTLQSKMSLSKTYFLYQHLFHSNAAKYIDHDFLVRSLFKSEQPTRNFQM